jgi:hypothetical protein
MVLWHVGVTDMNTIFLWHVGQRGKIGGMLLEDTPTTGMSAPPYLLSTSLRGLPYHNGRMQNKFRLGRGFFKLKLGH